MTLKQYRRAKQLTMQQLAKKAGLAEFSIERYEKGRMPAKRAMLKIYRATGGEVQPNDFYGVKPK